MFIVVCVDALHPGFRSPALKHLLDAYVPEGTELPEPERRIGSVRMAGTSTDVATESERSVVIEWSGPTAATLTQHEGDLGIEVQAIDC